MSAQTLISGGRILRPDEEHGVPEGWILVEGGQIAATGVGTPPDFTDAARIDSSGCAAAPGFIDMHVHGALGHDTMDADPDGLRIMAQFYARHGVTAFLPTTWTESRPKITAALEAIASLVGQPTGGAVILGAHLEGPYVNLRKQGAQDPRFVRRADREEALAWLDLGIIRLIALAPEFPQNHWLIEEAARRGIVVSAAHTEAGPDEIACAVRLGLRQATHIFNAMVGLHHRNPGTVGAVLTDDAVSCELIADGIHVHPVAMNLVVRAKGRDRVILVTDAVSPTGLPDGKYPLEDRVMEVKNGQVLLPDGTLAGSILTMDAALRNIMAAAKLPLAQAWPLASLNAARQMGIADRKGMLVPGHDADIVLLDADHRVRLTMVGGEVVFRA